MRLILTCLTLSLATPTLAHEGVKNPAVAARMHVMKEAGGAFKTLRQMNSGRVAFDAAQAQAALAALVQASAQTPDLFRAPETDPKSEAKPIIWEQFADFEAKSAALGTSAQGSVATLADLQAILPRVGGTCGACHDVYRVKK